MDALLQKGTLVDVTLAAEGKSIQVHRLVLCACSNYFQVIWKLIIWYILDLVLMVLYQLI